MLQIHQLLRTSAVLENVEPLGVFNMKSFPSLSLEEAEAAYAQTLPLVIRAFGEGFDETSRALVVRIDLLSEDKFTFQFPIEGPVRMYDNARDVLCAMSLGARPIEADPLKILRVTAVAPQRHGALCIEVDEPVPLCDVFPEAVRCGEKFNAGLVATAASFLPPHILDGKNRELTQRLVAIAYNSGLSLTASSRHMCDFIVKSPKLYANLQERKRVAPERTQALDEEEEEEEKEEERKEQEDRVETLA